MAAALRPIYAAANAQAAEQVPQAFTDGPRGNQVANDHRSLAAGLGERHTILRLPAGHLARNLHDKRHRELEYAAT